MHCDANAYCLLIPETSDFKCECKPGYNGTGHECVDVCLGYCDNEGVCLKDSRGQPSCRCSGSFTGKHCKEKSSFFYVTGSIAFGVFLIIIIVLFVWMICARFVNFYYFYNFFFLNIFWNRIIFKKKYFTERQREKNRKKC